MDLDKYYYIISLELYFIIDKYLWCYLRKTTQKLDLLLDYRDWAMKMPFNYSMKYNREMTEVSMFFIMCGMCVHSSLVGENVIPFIEQYLIIPTA